MGVYTIDDVKYTDPKVYKCGHGQYTFTTGFGKIDKLVGCLDNGDGCYWYVDKLKKAGVITKTTFEDSEYCQCYFYFKTKQSAEGFINRLNKWIEKRMEMVAALR